MTIDNYIQEFYVYQEITNGDPGVTSPLFNIRYKMVTIGYF